MKKISVFTPSHDPRFLGDCYQSLLNQTYQDWEWVVLLNGSAEWQPPSDDRVKTYATDDVLGVGAAKRRAVMLSSGDILVEFDHDDILLPEALEKVAGVFESDPEAVFVYSDFQQINEDGSPNKDRFSTAMGWEYDEDKCITFPQYPSAVSYIWFGPNHVRSFTRAGYDAVGGYDENLEVLDDQDLFCRLYQYGKFVGIPECLYQQRVHPGNTQVRQDLNLRIQIETVEMYDRFIQPNALAWAEREGLAAIDLGGAHNSPEGYISFDMHDGADITCDLTEGIPLPSDSVGVVRASDFLEHIGDKIEIMNEIWRVLAHGGMLLSLTPSSDGRGAYQDPTHVSFYNENSFWYYTDENFAKYVPEIKCRFQVSRLTTFFPTEWHKEHDISYVCANLVAIKEGGPRLPGMLNWSKD